MCVTWVGSGGGEVKRKKRWKKDELHTLTHTHTHTHTQKFAHPWILQGEKIFKIYIKDY